MSVEARLRIFSRLSRVLCLAGLMGLLYICIVCSPMRRIFRRGPLHGLQPASGPRCLITHQSHITLDSWPVEGREFCRHSGSNHREKSHRTGAEGTRWLVRSAAPNTLFRKFPSPAAFYWHYTIRLFASCFARFSCDHGVLGT